MAFCSRRRLTPAWVFCATIIREAVYSELRMLFRQALYEQQDLSAMAQKLAASLSTDRKIMLGVQLYDLISQAGLKQEQVVAFYSFMSQFGMAAQAIDIVYQLNASEDADQEVYQRGASPLEAISFGGNGKADIVLKSLSGNDRLLAFRYHDLILLKNYSGQAVSVRGRPLGARRILPDLSGATHPDRGFRCSPTRISPTISTPRRMFLSRRFSCG